MTLTSWTDERVETMRKLLLAGSSCSQIAAELGGVSRNAVIGKIHREGIKREGVVRVPKPKVKRLDARRNRARGARPALHFAAGPMIERDAVPRIRCDEINSEHITFLELGRIDPTGPMQCRFPTKIVDGEHRYCGNATSAGPWCVGHKSVVCAGRAA